VDCNSIQQRNGNGAFWWILCLELRGLQCLSILIKLGRLSSVGNPVGMLYGSDFLWEAKSTMWKLCINSTFNTGSKKTTENLYRVGQLQCIHYTKCRTSTAPLNSGSCPISERAQLRLLLRPFVNAMKPAYREELGKEFFFFPLNAGSIPYRSLKCGSLRLQIHGAVTVFHHR
jgi:hypothetical protein